MQNHHVVNIFIVIHHVNFAFKLSSLHCINDTE